METEKILDMIRGIEGNASVNAAFGEPKTVGDKTIIPVSSVWYGYGFGFGEAPKMKEEEAAQEQPAAGAGSGAGGGGGAKVVPIGYLEVTPSDVKFVGTPDTNRIAVLGMITAMWNVFWITRTIRFGASRKQIVHKGLTLPHVQMPDKLPDGDKDGQEGVL